MRSKLGKSVSQKDIFVTSGRRILSPTPKLDSKGLLPLIQAKAMKPHKRRTFADSSSSPPHANLSGLNQYCLQRTIGCGSFARVRLAVNRVTHEVVVVKAMSKALIVRRRQVAHVLSEKSILQSVQNPFVVALRGSFQDAFFLYLVLEYVQGGELYHLLAEEGRLGLPEAKFYGSEVVCALSYLHKKGIAYRDLKPENVLLTASGHIKLTDFGFAKVLAAGGKTFTLCGTPEYLAPEVINNEGHGFESDWWTLGVLMYEMIVGKPPFHEDSPYRLYEAILTAEVTFPSDVPLDARAFIGSLLIKTPKNRATEAQVKSHAFFSDVAWSEAEEGKLQPRYRPALKNPLDARHFDKYPETDLPVDEKKATDPHLFLDF